MFAWLKSSRPLRLQAAGIFAKHLAKNAARLLLRCCCCWLLRCCCCWLLALLLLLALVLAACEQNKIGHALYGLAREALAKSNNSHHIYGICR